MYLIQILLINILLSNTIDENQINNVIFIPPVKIPLALSANFGELRADHFHSGLDIKTQGVTGKEVVATESGYIYRISVSPGGFGKALYIRHPSGYSTVYGHLDRFIPEIEEYVESRQYEEKSYMVTLWVPKDKFRFNRGELIAYSGNSGSSSGPHLHYEIRKSDEEIPVNPLIFGFGIEDNIKPVIQKLVIYPGRRGTLINNQSKALKINVIGSNGKYFVPSMNIINISGSAGFGIASYDLMNNSPNKCSVFSIELKIDSLNVFSYKMDAFSFNETRYVNSHIDYESFVRDNIRIEKTFVLPNDKLSVYHNVINKGLFNFNDDKKHHIEIKVTDIKGNKSSLTFDAKSVPPGLVQSSETNRTEAVVMPYNRNNKFVSKNVIVNIPAGALYDTLFFEFRKTAGSQSGYSDIYQIHNRYTPVHKSYYLSIKPDRVPKGKESKLMMVQINGDDQKNPLQCSWQDGYLTANPASFGTFYIGIDTIAPAISSNGVKSGADLTGRKEMRFRITDSFSGIKTYEALIDNKWALFEYDQKNNVIIYRFDPKRIEKGTHHTLSLTVSDARDNISTLNWGFIW